MNRSKREAKYLRRKAARADKREVKLGIYDDFDRAVSIPSLINAAIKAERGVGWKPSVQRYMSELCLQSARTHKSLMEGKDIRKGFYEFTIHERGKVRNIKSLRFSERVVHKAFAVNALYPIFTNSLIYDNYASQKGKGTALALKRMKLFLQRHYRKYGREGGILLIDLSNYFGSIDHKVLCDMYDKAFKDKRLAKLGKMFVEAYGDVGLGLGSETCQVNAVRYADRVDHLAKDKLGIKLYCRYMDDTGIIHRSVEYLKEVLAVLEKAYADIGITLNRKKTKICDLKHGFTYLKNKFYLTETGKVIIKPCRATVTRERRRLHRQARLVERGLLDYDDVASSYYSWRGSAYGAGLRKRTYNGIKKNAYRTIRNMDILFYELFNKYRRFEYAG